MTGYPISLPARITTSILLCLVLMMSLALPHQASAQQTNQGHEEHQHHSAGAGKAPAPFIASTAKPFSGLMDDAMAVMDDGMRRALMNGVPEHDFVTMMIPHHQGAVNMAKALLLSTRDLEMRNLAQAIITEQQNEIRLMQTWLTRYQKSQAGNAAAPK